VSKTPRTDAVEFTVADTMFHPGEPIQVVSASFSRGLELKLAKLRERCARLKRQRDWLRLNHVSVTPRQTKRS
jgi:hypothetical protein